MSAPQALDLGRLKNILGNAKSIMKKVESNDFETGHIDARALTEDGVREMQAEGITRPATQSSQSVGYTEEMVQNSHLPEAIKKAMIEKPIQQLNNPNYTFSLSDVAELSEDKPMGSPRIPKTTPKKKLVQESYTNNEDYITIGKGELKEIVRDLVNEKLLEFFTKSYNEMITENAVKKTITLLIREGKLTPKKKTL